RSKVRARMLALPATASATACRTTSTLRSGLPTVSAECRRLIALVLLSPSLRVVARAMLSLLPAAPGVLVDVAVFRCVLGAACGLPPRVMAVRVGAGSGLRAVRTLHRCLGTLRGSLMLSVGGLAVLGDLGTSIASIGVRGLMGLAICPRIGVVCLTRF